MGWVFVLGLAVAFWLLYIGSITGFITALGATLVIIVGVGIPRSLREQRERRKRIDEVEQCEALLGQFRKEFNVLQAKDENGEAISPEAVKHYEQTYNTLMPLLRKFSYTFDSASKQEREEEGDYSKHPGVVETIERAYNLLRLSMELKSRAAAEIDDLSPSGLSGDCPKCTEYYPILRLNPGANEEQVKTAYRDLAQIYHPDRFGSSDESVRKTAEDKMKKTNEAYGHIMEHFAGRTHGS